MTVEDPAASSGTLSAGSASPSDNDSDDTLMAWIGKGDQRAYGLLVSRHLDKSLGFAQRVLGDRGEAEDVLQDAFLRVWKKAPDWTLDGGARFSTWFYRVVLNLCIDRKRRPPPLPMEPSIDVEDETPSADAGMERHQASGLVDAAMAALPERQRAAIALCYFDELSNKEAADILDIGVKALESLLVRARRNMQDHFNAAGKFEYGDVL